MARSIVQSSSGVEKHLNAISEKEKKVDEIARLIDTDCRLLFFLSPSD